MSHPVDPEGLAARFIDLEKHETSEIIADGDLQATAGCDNGENGCDARSGFLAAEVDPVFAIMQIFA
jgi:hypothetical protein